jgi:hypothetical protein
MNEHQASSLRMESLSRRHVLNRGLQVATLAALTGCATPGAMRGSGATQSMSRTPQDFGAAGDGTTDDTAAFRAAAARPGDFIRVPAGRYLVNGTVEIQDAQTWQFENAQVIHREAGPAFKAASVSDWALLGILRMEGAGGRRTSAANTGLLVEGGKRYRVSRIQFSRFAHAGLVVTAGSGSGAGRGDRGQLSDLGFNECATGIDMQAASGAEYNIFTNTAITGCDVAIMAAAGNTQFIGGNAVDCTQGIVLNGGHNHAHGGFHGFNINHCSQYSVLATSITYGHTFSGCHFYGDNRGAGMIFLKDCTGISIQGGQLDCGVLVDGSGSNFLLNNIVVGQNFHISSNTGNQASLVCRNNLRFDGTDACPR